MSSIVDESLRNVTAALQANMMWETTLMVVASDNGGSLTQTKASNFPLRCAAHCYPPTAYLRVFILLVTIRPLRPPRPASSPYYYMTLVRPPPPHLSPLYRGGKMAWTEGGVRTTAWVTGGMLPPAMRGTNLSSAHLIAVCDWHSTFLALAKAHEKGEQPHAAPAPTSGGVLPSMDGIDQWPVISGQSNEVLREEVFIGSGVVIRANFKLIAADTRGQESRWSGPLYPKVPATGQALNCTQEAPCLFDVVADYREEHDLASTKPEVVGKLQARLAELMKTVFEADPVPNATQAKVCAASVANGMWITPYDWPLLPPTPPAPAPPTPEPLSGNQWFAFQPQWQKSPPPNGTGNAMPQHPIL